MRACIVKPDTWSFAVDRVERALRAAAPPGLTFTDNHRQASVVVVPVIGRHDRVLSQVTSARSLGQRVGLIQYCLRSTMRTSTLQWFDVWEHCDLIWSYYDLATSVAEDGGTWDVSRFYHRPLGADATVFSVPPTEMPRPFVICASGRAWLTESARECAFAAKAVNRRALFLGPEQRKRYWVHCVTGVSDEALAAWYGACEYVSGLRRVEGFELPAIEGLLCGARPVLFDRPHYRHWFQGFAEFIHEGDRQSVIDALTGLFSQPLRPVTEEERQDAVRRFDWIPICEGFWERLLA